MTFTQIRAELVKKCLCFFSLHKLLTPYSFFGHNQYVCARCMTLEDSECKPLVAIRENMGRIIPALSALLPKH